MNRFFKSASTFWGAFLFVLFIIGFPAKAQVTETSFRAVRDSLALLFSKINDSGNAAKIDALLENFLKEKNAFEFRFDLDKNLSDLVSDDKNVRVVSWTYRPAKGNFVNYGYVLLQNKKTGETNFFKLKALYEKPENIERKTLNYQNWNDCVYYKLITKKYKKKTFYTLLGFDGNDGITNKKIIEVLAISGKGEPVFGAPVFLMRKQKWHRIIFEYNAQAVMHLNYDEKKNMILFDHLSPSDPSQTGRFQFYGPDFSIDGLHFKKGLWILEEDVDAKNKK